MSKPDPPRVPEALSAELTFDEWAKRQPTYVEIEASAEFQLPLSVMESFTAGVLVEDFLDRLTEVTTNPADVDRMREIFDALGLERIKILPNPEVNR